MCKNLDSISDFNISGVKPLGSLAPPKNFQNSTRVCKKITWAPPYYSQQSSPIQLQIKQKTWPTSSPNSLSKQSYSFLNHRHFQPSPNPKSKIPN